MNELNFVGESISFGTADITKESFKLNESLCSTGALSFGSCESNRITVQVRYSDSLIGTEYDVNYNDIPIGHYKVIEDKPTANKCYRNITLVDRMYDIINTECRAWYESLTFPLTVEAFRTSFFNYVGIEQEECELPFDDMLIGKIEGIESVTGQKILTDLCQLNGCFGNINRSGKFEYVWLNSKLTPSETLYPSDDLYPGQNVYADAIGKHKYKKCIYADYYVQSIDAIAIVDEQNETASIVGEGNTYTITNNMLLIGKGYSECDEIATKLLSIINGLEFVPLTANIEGDINIHLGDCVEIAVSVGNIPTFILEHTLSGIQSLGGKIEADCSKYVEDNNNTLSSAITYIKATQEKTVTKVATLEADSVVVHGELTAQSGRIGTLEADHVSVADLSAATARIGNLEADHVSTSTITAINGSISSLQTNKLDASSVTADYLNAKYASATRFTLAGLRYGSMQILVNTPDGGTKYVTVLGTQD